MAKPIKETPILKGADARKFVENLANTKKVDDTTKAKMKVSFDRLNSMARF
jgi:hypothetical protein